MALATTCPQCKTSFKVVPDQLKLRRGLVRCGVCQNVFSGVEHLRYVDKDENEDTAAEAQETITASPPSGRSAAQDGRPPARPARGHDADAEGIPEEQFRGISLDIDSDTSLDDDGRFGDLTKGLNFTSTHPGSDPLDSDSTDPVTQTMVATTTGNTLTSAPSGEDGAQGSQAWRDHDGRASATAGGTQTAAGQAGSTGAQADGGAASGAADRTTTTASGTPADRTGASQHAADSRQAASHQTGAAGSGLGHASGTSASQGSAGHAATDHAGSASDQGTAGQDATADATSGASQDDGASSPRDDGRHGGKDSRSARHKDRKRRSRWATLIRGKDDEEETDDAGTAAPAAPEKPAAKPAAHADDESLNTVFFMADNEAPLPGHEQQVQLPASLRSGHGTPAATADIDPDTQAAGALVDEANRIWRQQKPRRALVDEDGDSDARHASPGGREGRSSESGERRRSRRRSQRSSSRSHALSGSAATHFDDGLRLRHPAEHQGWLKPAHRRALTIGLSALAIVQLVAVFRTEIAYHTPFLRPVASAASMATGQTIQPPMSLSSLSIESFELRNTRQPGQTRMTAILRNRSSTFTRWPAMELTLTGPSNAILVRKVLMPSQYLPASRNAALGMTPSSEQPLDLMLDTGDLNLAGYSVSLFYP